MPTRAVRPSGQRQITRTWSCFAVQGAPAQICEPSTSTCASCTPRDWVFVVIRSGSREAPCRRELRRWPGRWTGRVRTPPWSCWTRAGLTARRSGCEDHQCAGRGQSLITGCRSLSAICSDRTAHRSTLGSSAGTTMLLLRSHCGLWANDSGCLCARFCFSESPNCLVLWPEYPKPESPMAARNRSNPLALAVLISLYERPMHPYEVATTLRQRHKHESVRLNYGSLYSVVESLERRGLITPQGTERSGRLPERTIYDLTDAGRVETHDWLTELISTPVKDYPEFEAALSFLPALPPNDVVALLRERTQLLQIELAQMASARELVEKQHLPRLFRSEEIGRAS